MRKGGRGVWAVRRGGKGIILSRMGMMKNRRKGGRMMKVTKKMMRKMKTCTTSPITLTIPNPSLGPPHNRRQLRTSTPTPTNANTRTPTPASYPRHHRAAPPPDTHTHTRTRRSHRPRVWARRTRRPPQHMYAHAGIRRYRLRCGLHSARLPSFLQWTIWILSLRALPACLRHLALSLNLLAVCVCPSS